MSPSPSAAPASVLHHVTLKTTRLQEMIDWYAVVAGIKVNFQDAVGAWTSNDRANHRMALLAVPGLIDDPDKHRRTGMHHMAFEYETLDALLAHYASLKERGITPAFCLDHGVTTSLYYYDPDENVVELQVDNFGDWDRSAEWMRTSAEFRANPIGVFFDPDQMYRAHRSGMSFEEIHRRAYAAEYLPNPLPDLRIGG
jgi:catechol 2,3-dioxygenase